MFLFKAMRYYRLWIYSCNVALLVSVVAFVTSAVWYLSDFRMALFPAFRYHNPSMLYAYLALVLQGGILQAIGCYGAIKMNERFLNAYWTLMLALLFGDVVMGVIWLYRFQNLSQNLREDLRSRVLEDYGLDAEFQNLWDRIQAESQCCGVYGPVDYNASAWISRQRAEFPHHRQMVPRSCCKMHPNGRLHGDQPLNVSCVESNHGEQIYVHGCYSSVCGWLQHAAHVLGVLGFCVVSFLKVCFAGILRYEIREMIQKIQILKDIDEPSMDTMSSSRNNLRQQSSQNSEKPPPNGNNNDSDSSPLPKKSSPV